MPLFSSRFALFNPFTTGLGSVVVECSPAVQEVPGLILRVGVIPNTLKMVVMASLLGTQELRVSITTDFSVSV